MSKKAPPPQTDHKKAFLKHIESFRYKHNVYDVFRDFTELAAAALHNGPYTQGILPKDADYEREEAAYMAAAKRYTREELDTFSHMLACTVLALHEKPQDFLGRVYMNLEISNDARGQFFTPYELSLMMAMMQLPNVCEVIERKGFFTMQEPACGAGGMVVAAAQVVAEQGHSPATMYFDATDVDRQCCNMTFIQTAILGLYGYVRWGNSLSLETHGGRFTPAARVHPWRTNAMLASLRTCEVIEGEAEAVAQPTTDTAIEELAAPALPREQMTFDF